MKRLIDKAFARRFDFNGLKVKEIDFSNITFTDKLVENGQFYDVGGLFVELVIPNVLFRFWFFARIYRQFKIISSRSIIVWPEIRNRTMIYNVQAVSHGNDKMI